MIEFKCSNCSHKIGAPERYAGKRVRCPKCKAPTRVPESVGKTATQEPALIKFRCPSCNQKIGVTPAYAGKRVRCSKCKNPLRVPQAPSQAARSTVKDETAVLRAGQEQRPAEEGIQGGLGSMDELLLAEANAPSVERQMEQSPADYGAGESEFSAYTSAEGGMSRDRPKKRRSIIFIGGACALVLLLVGIVVWSFVSYSSSSEGKMEEDRLPKVQEFANEYIGLLENGEIDEARELLSPALRSDVQKADIERFANQIGKSKILELGCEQTHFEEHPEGNQFLLWYNLRYKDGRQFVIVSVLEIDGELKIDGIAAQDSFGGTVSIGPSSYKELSDIVITATLEKFGSIFSRFFCGFALVVLVLGLVQIVSMWVVFDKAGQPGWAALVPFYNMWVLAEVGDKPGWLGLSACFCGVIPFVGPIIQLVLWMVISIGVAKAFSRGVAFGIGLTLVPIVFYPILAFARD